MPTFGEDVKYSYLRALITKHLIELKSERGRLSRRL